MKSPHPEAGETGERALEQEMTLAQHGLAERRDAASGSSTPLGTETGPFTEDPKVCKMDCFWRLGQHEKREV